MALGDLTRSSVIAALNEYDTLGQDAFLTKYGFSHARNYLLHRDGKKYDSKAIAGAAHGHLPGRPPLQPSEFSGGEASVVRKLRNLGFQVPPSRSPSWEWDEIVLACDLVAQNDWNYLTAEDPQVAELSELLQQLPLHPVEVRSDTFRNPNGVARKTVDIATHHPEYPGRPTKGGGLDEIVLQEFISDGERMHSIATALRQTVASGASHAQIAPAVDEVDGAIEGRLLQRHHFARERDSKLRSRKIKDFLRTHDRVCCEACAFDFERKYGARGQGYIEVHHTLPLHASGERLTKLADLVLLCANCHRMVHSKSPWLTFDELQTLVRAPK